jgi:type IV pilus assembly protein PilA
VQTQRGFTLIELLIVVVIIGLLAAIAIPKFVNTKEKTYVAAMKSDLRNLATAQEAFFYDSAYYTTNLTALSRYAATTGVTVTVNEATPAGWSATTIHGLTPRECYLFSGGAAPIGTATVEGRITCT